MLVKSARTVSGEVYLEKCIYSRFTLFG